MPASGLSGSRAGYLNLNLNLNPVGPTLFLTVAKHESIKAVNAALITRNDSHIPKSINQSISQSINTVDL